LENNKVTLKVGPLILNLTTSDTAQYAQALAAELDSRLTAMMNSNSNMTLAQAMALVSLDAMDSVKKANDAADNLRGLLKTYLEDVNKYRCAAEDAKRENERLRAELDICKNR